MQTRILRCGNLNREAIHKAGRSNSKVMDALSSIA